MSKIPGKKGLRRRLRDQQVATSFEIRRALTEASKALDESVSELNALRRILISERAQVVYYTEKYRQMVMRECLDVAPRGFLELTEEEQTVFITQAVKELRGDSMVPHDPEALKAAEQEGDAAMTAENIFADFDEGTLSKLEARELLLAIRNEPNIVDAVLDKLEQEKREDVERNGKIAPLIQSGASAQEIRKILGPSLSHALWLIEKAAAQ